MIFINVQGGHFKHLLTYSIFVSQVTLMQQVFLFSGESLYAVRYIMLLSCKNLTLTLLLHCLATYYINGVQIWTCKNISVE